jgi:hypothetical protein
LRTFCGHEEEVFALAVTQRAVRPLLFSAGMDRSIKCWRLPLSLFLSLSPSAPALSLLPSWDALPLLDNPSVLTDFTTPQSLSQGDRDTIALMAKMAVTESQRWADSWTEGRQAEAAGDLTEECVSKDNLRLRNGSLAQSELDLEEEEALREALLRMQSHNEQWREEFPHQGQAERRAMGEEEAVKAEAAVGEDMTFAE